MLQSYETFRTFLAIPPEKLQVLMLIPTKKPSALPHESGAEGVYLNDAMPVMFKKGDLSFIESKFFFLAALI